MACAASAVLIGNSMAPAFAGNKNGSASNDDNTASPIKHVIVIIGENRSFDHVFATYKPANSTDTVMMPSERRFITVSVELAGL